MTAQYEVGLQRLRDAEQRRQRERLRDAIEELGLLELAALSAWHVVCSVGLTDEQVEVLGDLYHAGNPADSIRGTCDLIRDALSEADERLDT